MAQYGWYNLCIRANFECLNTCKSGLLILQALLNRQGVSTRPEVDNQGGDVARGPLRPERLMISVLRVMNELPWPSSRYPDESRLITHVCTGADWLDAHHGRSRIRSQHLREPDGVMLPCMRMSCCISLSIRFEYIEADMSPERSS